VPGIVATPSSDELVTARQKPLKIRRVEKTFDRAPIPESQAQVWAEVLAHELSHRSHPCLEGQVACQVFHDAKPAMKVYTLGKRKEAFD
jgi:hypothetical protein